MKKDSNICILWSSDSPVQDLDPFLQMRGMTEYYIEGNSISPEAAYETYSVNAGKALGEDFP
ncbi:MAG: hypothetical protein SPJ34_00435, partial [Candidatus Ornithospirochaeta sp.]|nr:hypothetical protein [Candidatus Ornithospirochaeta sp.]